MSFAQDQNVVQTLASDGADEPFREGVLPRALRSGEDFTDPHALHALLKYVAVDAVAIAKEIRRCAVVRESLHDLLGGPVSGGVLGYVEVDDAPTMVSEHDQNEEDVQARGGNREEIERDQVADMVGQERSPGLRRLGRPLRHEPGDGALGHVDAELQEFAMDARGSPEGLRGERTWSSTGGSAAAATAGRWPGSRSRGPVSTRSRF
jgi:hypothetical protein